MIMKKTALFLIKGYRHFISPFLKGSCRFYPSCSLYAQIAVERFGFFVGCFLLLKRLLKCHPWHNGDGYDPVPEDYSVIRASVGVRRQV